MARNSRKMNKIKAKITTAGKHREKFFYLKYFSKLVNLLAGSFL